MWIVIISTLILVSITWLYLSYKDKTELIKAFVKVYAIVQLKKLLHKLENKDNKGASTEDASTIVFKENHVHITYYLNGNPHNVRIPHFPKNKLKLHQMILVTSSVEIDITHKHGLPYYLSAKDLGGHKIVHKKGNEVIHEFHEDELPYI